MKRYAAFGGLVVVVIAVLVWYLWGRDRGDAAKPAEPARSAKIEPKPTAPPPHAADAPAPRGIAPRWVLDADREGPLRLEGQVVGPDGKGVGGAEVWLGSVPPRTAKTEDDGTFAFDKLSGRTYPLTARHGDLIGGPVMYKLTEKSDPVVVRIGEGATVRVTVVDEGKQPIAGADVAIEEIGRRTEKTDDKGVAKLAPVQPGWVVVDATAPGYASATAYTTVGSAGATGDVAITLRKGYAVSGKVIDEAGKPIAKVRVTASDSGYGLTRNDEPATSDDKGQFTIAALPSGTHTLSAVDGEHAPAQSLPITVGGKPVSNVEIQMKEGGVLAGTVVDRDGKLAAFATVRVAGTGAAMWRSQARQTTTDQSGAFQLHGLARAKLQARAESDIAASKVVDLDLTDKHVQQDVKLVLDVSGTITGIVVDDKGAPVPEVAVNAFPDILAGASADGLALAGMTSATTGGGGEFVIHGLPDGGYRLWAARHAAGFREWGQQGVPAKTGDKNVKITLAAGGMLTGKVVLAGAQNPPKLVMVQLGYQPATPATDGVFQLKDLEPGSYDVTFRGPEFAELIKHDVKVDPAKTTDLGTITVNRGRRLVGKVVDKDGAPVGGAKIKVGMLLISSGEERDNDQSEGFDQMRGVRSTISDQDGGFTLIGVPTKATNVMADHPDRGRSLATPVPEGTDDPPPVTLVVRGYGSIVGKVTQKGQPAADIAVGESSKGGGAQGTFTRTGADGTFTLAKVPEGVHVINAMQQQLMSMKSTSITVTVTAGKQTTANIDIPVGTITLTVQPKALANNKVDAAQVFLFAGAVNITNGKQLLDSLFQSSIQGIKVWFGEGKPAPEYTELVAGDYSACGVPVTGDMSDPKLQQRIQENMATMKVYCKPIKVTPSPNTQTFVMELPSMTPLPDPPR